MTITLQGNINSFIMTKGFGRNGETRKSRVNDNVCKFLIAINTKYEDKIMEHEGLSEIFLFTEEKSSLSLLSSSSP